MQKILAFSGKRNSGKNTLSNFLVGNFLYSAELVKNFNIDEAGKLQVETHDGNIGFFPIDVRSGPVFDYLKEQVFPWIRPFAFADPMKRHAIDFFGLPEELVYGGQDEKNTPTEYTWQQFYNLIGVDSPNTAFMTIRDILKFVGTEMYRDRFDKNFWVKRFLKDVERSDTELATATDTRFPNEVFGVKEAGGKVIRLTKTTFHDEHESETSLDPDKFDWDNFDAVLDNQNLTMEQTFEALIDILSGWGWY